MVTGVVPSPPRFLPSIFFAHRVQQSHCSSISHRVLLTHALALSASQFVHKKKSQRVYTSMHSAALELTKLTYTKLEDNLIRHPGDRDIPYTQYMPCILENYGHARSQGGRQAAAAKSPWYAFIHVCKLPLQDVVGLKSRGCRTYKRGGNNSHPASNPASNTDQRKRVTQTSLKLSLLNLLLLNSYKHPQLGS